MKFKSLLAVALVLAAVATPRGEIIEQILVKVNGDIFTKSDLEQRQIAALRQKGNPIDLKSDPNELRNIYADPDQKPLIAKLETELYRLKKELKDDDQFATQLPPDGVDGPFPGDRK